MVETLTIMSEKYTGIVTEKAIDEHGDKKIPRSRTNIDS